MQAPTQKENAATAARATTRATAAATAGTTATATSASATSEPSDHVNGTEQAEHSTSDSAAMTIDQMFAHHDAQQAAQAKARKEGRRNGARNTPPRDPHAFVPYAVTVRFDPLNNHAISTTISPRGGRRPSTAPAPDGDGPRVKIGSVRPVSTRPPSRPKASSPAGPKASSPAGPKASPPSKRPIPQRSASTQHASAPRPLTRHRGIKQLTPDDGYAIPKANLDICEFSVRSSLYANKDDLKLPLPHGAPSPINMLGRCALQVVEILAGLRPIGHVRTVLAPNVYAALNRRAGTAYRVASSTGNRPVQRGTPHTQVGVFSFSRARVVHASLVVFDGVSARAVCMRAEMRHMKWTVVTLDVI